MKKYVLLALWLLSSFAFAEGVEIEFLLEETETNGKLVVMGDVDMPLAGDQYFCATSGNARLTYEYITAIIRKAGRLEAMLTDLHSDERVGEWVFFRLEERVDGREQLVATRADESTLIWKWYSR